MSEQGVGARLRGMEIFLAGYGRGVTDRLGDGPAGLGGLAGLMRDPTLRFLAAWQIPACDEQISQRTGHKQAMSVFLQPAIAYLGEAKHALDDLDRMFDPSAHFGLDTIFRSLDLVDDAAVAVAAIGEVLGRGGVLTDHRPLAAVGLIAPYPGATARAARVSRRHWPACGGNTGSNPVGDTNYINGLMILVMTKCPTSVRYRRLNLARRLWPRRQLSKNRPS